MSIAPEPHTEPPRESDAPALGSSVARAFTAHLRLFAETLVVDHSGEELVTGAAALSFDYGGTRVRAADPRDRFFRTGPGAMVAVDRDRAGELEIRRLIESFGAIEMSCLDGAGTSGLADYVVDPEADVHALCTFTAYALPQLRARGVKVDLAPDYPWQTVDGERGWFATVREGEAEDDRDWFSLELGIDVGGERKNLLPILLDLLDKAPPGLDLAALAKSERRRVGLPLGPRRWLALEPERLRAILRVLLELHQERDGERLWANEVQAAAIQDLVDVFGEGGLTLEAPPAVRRRTRSLASLGDDPAWTPAGLCATLRPYQRHGLSWLTDLAQQNLGGVLADDMGLGKTLQVIAHLLVERDAGRAEAPALVVAPTSLAGNWTRELARFAPSLKVVAVHGPRRTEAWARAKDADVVLTTYPVVLRDEAALEGREFSLVVLDEAQAIKNSRSQIHQAVRAIAARRRLCMSGTPLENNLGELHSLFDFAVPGLLGSASVFRESFARPIEKDGCMDRLEALRRRVAPFILRRVKNDVAPELPPKTEIVRPVELAGAQRDLYETIRLAAHAEVQKAVQERGMARSTITILDALMKLRQACCDPRIVHLDAARTVRASAKYDLLFEILDAQLSLGHRVLIFSQFTSMLALIAKGLAERSVRHAILTGATHDRQEQVDAFQRRRVEVFLISLKAGGTGLNLTEADTVIHYDPWWNPAAQAQATDRAYRIGQLQPVFVYNLIVAGSVEERILALQRRKRELADGILADGEQQSLALSEDDVEELLAPLDSEDGEAAGPTYVGSVELRPRASRHEGAHATVGVRGAARVAGREG